MKVLYTVLILMLCFNLFSQRGKDGSYTVTATNTIVNQYTSLTANVASGTKTLTVASSAAFNVGDLVYVIQMQGASVNAYHGGLTGPWFDSQSALPTDNSYGNITNYNNCGLNEFAQVNSIPNGTSIVLDCDLTNSYDASVVSTINTGSGTYTINLPGKVQVVKVPRYSSLTINSPGSITCPQWNGTTGGIAVVEVENDATLNSTPSFSVSGKGFRGGIKDNAGSVFGGDKFGSNNRAQGGIKGESINGDTTLYIFNASLAGRGAVANGGGGGCAHNAGGGGGANGGNTLTYTGFGNPNISVTTYTAIWNRESPAFSSTVSSGGGRGGYAFSNTNVTLNSASNPPGSTNWGGDSRRNTGGFGGRPLNYSTGRLFLAGGGGAGDGNENQAGAGGNGGGMVYVVCYGNLTGAGTIIADGANGLPSNPGCSTNDAGGGGGGGGTIVLNVNGTTNLTATPALSARGGNGGNVNFSCGAVFNDDGYGPGGSGGGGYISTSGTMPANTIVAGTNGIVTGNSSNIAAQFPMNGSTNGASGSTGTISNYTLTTSASQTLCANQSFTVTANSTQPGTSINWYNNLVGGSAIATGTAYAASGYTTAGTYTLFAGACGGTYRQPIVITVGAGLSISVNSPTICTGQNAILTATSSATSYTWSTSANTASISVAPSSTAVYTITGSNGTCSGTQTATVTVSPQPTVVVSSQTICAGTSATLTASGATNFTWLPGGQTTTSIVVTPTITSTYSITGATGSCTHSTTASVSITPTPTLTAASQTICPGQTATFTVSGAATYTWNPGSVTGSTYTIAPASNTTVSVIGANGTCTAQTTASVTIGSGLSIAVNNATICPGQSAVLTPSSTATSYIWNTGATTNTLSVNPGSSTTYTISGTAGACSGSNTAVVTVIAQPTLSVASTSICSGSSSTLTVSGSATNYTWSPGGQTTTSIVVTPTTTSTYSITGTNGTCTNSTTASVNITATPTLVANSTTICAGQTATLTVGTANTYTWNPGSVTGNTYTIAPASNTVVSVIGANGTCTTQTTASVTVGSAISIAINSATICEGQSATLTPTTSATSFTWNTGVNTNSLSVSPTSTSIYTLVAGNGSCSGSNTTTVTVNAVPVLTVTSNNICTGQTATLTAMGANTYTWSNSVNGSTQTVSPASTTIYTVSGTSLAGCINTTIATTTINVTSVPNVSITSSPTICAGQTATLNAVGATNYTWSTTETTSSINVAPSSITSYTVTGDNGGCTASYTTTVNVTPSPSLTINALNTTGCPTLCVNFTDNVLPASSTISYNFGDGNNGTTNNPIHCYVNGGNYTVTATATNSVLGCSATYTLPTIINVINSPVADFNIQGGNVVIVNNSVNFINASTNATSYAWDLCNGNTSGLTDITTSYADTGSCCITLLAANGTCTNSVTKCIEIINEASINIPNVFTPNDDSKNDVFKITGSGIKSLNCVIFDRWGLKMFEWTGINGGWDGNVKSGFAPSGTYFFIINYTDYKDETTTEKGFLSLFRE